MGWYDAARPWLFRVGGGDADPIVLVMQDRHPEDRGDEPDGRGGDEDGKPEGKEEVHVNPFFVEQHTNAPPERCGQLASRSGTREWSTLVRCAADD